MKNMFTGLNQKTYSKNLQDCTLADPVSNNLWGWAERCENFAIWGSFLIGIITIILLTVSIGGLGFLIGIPIGIIVGIMYYLANHTVALLIAALASIVYNTNVSANVNILTASLNNEINNDNINKSEHLNKESVKANTDSKQSNIWICKECGQKNSNTRTICLKCGAETLSETTEKNYKTCNYCRKQVPIEQERCECGCISFKN